ncbi:MAG: hypothetical protein KAI79_17565 [Bacteroidales bacterium]|nr:hypothetical protein [Bacteroidales bacterium]
MKLTLLAVITAMLFTGCGVGEKSSVVLECSDEGLTIIKLYKENYVSSGENIVVPSNLRKSQVYSRYNKTFKCVKETK